jgi:hypothetical protein
MITDIFHADWSTNPGARWAVRARKIDGDWLVSPPEPMTDAAGLKSTYADYERCTLAGFDFPIGVPRAYGARSGFSDFKALLTATGKHQWSEFYKPAESQSDISLRRPFYPASSGTKGQHKQEHLFNALDLNETSQLRRRCETTEFLSKEASPLFWTIGAQQVGKAAIHSWQRIVQPALQNGARIWPFDGALEVVTQEAGLVICETYPTAYYPWLGLKIGKPGKPKGDQQTRANEAINLLSFIAARPIIVMPAMRDVIVSGFPKD